jgi:hypothetical protein
VIFTLRAYKLVLLCVAGKSLQQKTFETLPEDIPLDVSVSAQVREERLSETRHPSQSMDFAHVFRKWRHDLRIICTSGASIERIMGSWPTLPLVVHLEKTPISKSLHSNFVVALRHPDRVCEIDLNVTSSIAGLIAEAIQQPFHASECV